MPTNTITHLREAFEEYRPNVAVWAENRAPGDIVQLEGNAAAASYLVISKDPLTAGTETMVMTASDFEVPFEAALGLHMSQRTLGQEFSVEFVSTEPALTPPADLAISSISQATTTLTVSTVLSHNLRPGQRIGIFGCADSRMNYPSLVVATTPTATQFTATAGPGGTIPSVTAGPFTSGSVYVRSALGFAPNGTSMIFENATATNASFYVRSASGDVLPSGTVAGNHSVTVLTTASVQALNTTGAYAFQPTDEYWLTQMQDDLQWSDVAVDSVAQRNNRYKRTQVVPQGEVPYRLRFRATNNKGLSTPVAQIVSAAKTGTTTATVVTDVPHGLTTGDLIVTYGVRDTTNFANLATATAVASVVNATSFTVVWGSAVTATSFGGYVARVNGGNLMSALGAITQVAQSISRTSNVVTVVGSAAWTGTVIGDFINLVGIRDNSTGASLGLDGPYRVRDIATTNLVLDPIGTTPTGADIGSVNCGGAVIRRTCLRISFARITDYYRDRVEFTPRPSGDAAAALPVVVQNTPATTISSGTVTANVTGYPTAAASADALANPTVTKIDALSSLFNGTTWDRARGNTAVTVETSTARTATGTGTTQTNFNSSGVILFINVSTVSGTTPTLAVRVQVQDPVGAGWVDVPGAVTASITGGGLFMLAVYPGATVAANAAVSYPLPRIWRVAWTIGGTTPSFTFSVGAQYVA